MVPRGQPDRPGARRRGHRERGRLQPVRPHHAERPADGQPGVQERLRGRGPAGGGHPAAGDRRHPGGRRLLARHPDRARLLDGPGADRRPRRPELRARHGHRERRGPGRAAAGPLGRRRLVPGPHAPGQGRPAGPERLPHRGDDQGRPRPRREADLAELRGIPGRAGARRADRRRPGAARLAVGADLPVQVVPDRVAVQVQRQVLSRLAAAVLRVPEHQGRAADRGGRPGGGGVPGLAAARAAPRSAQARPVQAPAAAAPRPGAPALTGLPGLPRAERTLVMGVVNVTPDSFSDGGRWFGADAAIKHGLDLVAQGADLVDVGGESTRPGAQRVSEEEELRRIGPVVTELAGAGVPVSIDTMRAAVAEFALDAGAVLVNDVSGGLADPQMPRLVAVAGVSYVVVHWRGHSRAMYSAPSTPTWCPRSATSSPPASTRWWRPASTRTASWSTRGSGSANGRSTTGRC